MSAAQVFSLIGGGMILLLAIVTDRAFASLDRRVTRIETERPGRDGNRKNPQ